MEKVCNQNLIVTYIGLSTDTKPTAYVDDGAQYYEADTGDTYTYHGGRWYSGTYLV